MGTSDRDVDKAYIGGISTMTIKEAIFEALQESAANERRRFHNALCDVDAIEPYENQCYLALVHLSQQRT